jgi:hypothetical protein
MTSDRRIKTHAAHSSRHLGVSTQRSTLLSDLSGKPNPTSRPQLARELGVGRLQLVTGHRLDVRLCIDGVVTNPYLGVPAIAHGHSVDFNSVTSVIGIDQHTALSVMRPRSQSRFRR